MPPRAFLSHADADKHVADDVKTMLQTAIGINPGEIFYSSGKGTGVPAGDNFVEYIRGKMQGSTFVIAIVTPAFRDSEFCLAELGAVWLAADKDFFPLCSPNVDRSSLQATLTGIQVERLDDSASLMALLQRVAVHFKREFNAAACDEAVSVFLSTLPARLEALAKPVTVPAAELEAAAKTAASLGAQLTEARDAVAAERKRFDELRAAKTREEVEAAALPAETSEQVDALLKEARVAVRNVGDAVARAIPYELQGEGMPRPDEFGLVADDVKKAAGDGYLTAGDDDRYYLDQRYPEIRAAVDAAKALQARLDDLDPDEEEWFTTTYRVPPDLRQSAAFRQLMLIR